MIRSLIAAAFLLIAAIANAPVHADAEPTATLTLQDDRTVSGTIVRELDGYIWLDLGLGEAVLYKPDEYKAIQREGGHASSGAVVLSKKTSYRDEPIEDRPGVIRAAVISLEETVGTHMTATPLEEAIEELEADQIDLLVLKVKSGGGMLIEIEKMSNVIHEEFKPRFKTVAWIESAISAAAMTSYTCEDIYFMTKGNFGSATGWFQNGGSIGLVEGRDLEEALYLMERIAERSGHNADLFRSMQILETPISYDRDPETGEVSIYNDTSGEFVLNDGTDITSLNSEQAMHIGLAKGIADTTDELADLLLEHNPELRGTDIVWVGDRVAGELYPITEAERIQREWREEADYIDGRFNELGIKYDMAIANAQTARSFVVQAERYLAQIERLARKHVNLAFTRGLNDEWFRQQRELIAELRRR